LFCVSIFRQSPDKHKRRSIRALFLAFLVAGACGVATAAANAPGPPSAWTVAPLDTPSAGDPAAGQRLWSVPLHPGDRLTVTFETRGAGPVRLCVLSALVQDADAPAPPALRCATARPGQAGGLVYVATRAAAYGLDFVPPGAQPSPYAFTVSVTRHAQTSGEAVGGETVAGAPLLVREVWQYGDTVDGERFWRLSVPPASRIVVSWANTGTTSGGRLAVLAPGAAAGGPGVATQTAAPSQHRTLSVASRLGGVYVLDFEPSGASQSYAFLARIRPLDAGPLRTAVTAGLPKVARGGVLRATATVRPATAQPRGRCRLEQRRGSAWRPLATVRVRSLGRCSFRVTLQARAVMRVRFLPAAGFAGSVSPAATVRVA
jgi:hypothetical protein